MLRRLVICVLGALLLGGPAACAGSARTDDTAASAELTTTPDGTSGSSASSSSGSGSSGSGSSGSGSSGSGSSGSGSSGSGSSSAGGGGQTANNAVDIGASFHGEYSFGRVRPGHSTARTLLVGGTPQGVDQVRVTGVVVTGTPSGVFRLERHTCRGVSFPGPSCSADVTATPPANGVFHGRIEVQLDRGGFSGSAVLTVTGGTGPPDLPGQSSVGTDDNPAAPDDGSATSDERSQEESSAAPSS